MVVPAHVGNLQKTPEDVGSEEGTEPQERCLPPLEEATAKEAQSTHGADVRSDFGKTNRKRYEAIENSKKQGGFGLHSRLYQAFVDAEQKH